MNRRKFMAMMAAGAVMTAEGLWMPGQKLISIPSIPLNMTATEINVRFAYQQAAMRAIIKKIDEDMIAAFMVPYLNPPDRKWLSLNGR